jgi:MinD superfamily P-loop ATPase
MRRTHVFKGLQKAVISQEKCTNCGECVGICRFDAIVMSDGKLNFTVDPVSCEGCGVCEHICLRNAIHMEDNISGEWYISETKYGPMVHAKLGIAEENSGKLVSIVRQNAKNIAEQTNADYVIIDGPPGIGCPVIASLSGVDIALVVTEPTLSAIHDMKRVIGVAQHFGVRAACVINKYDINLDNTQRITDWCRSNKIPLLGKVPFDLSVTKSIVERVPLVEKTENSVTKVIKEIWKGLL